MPKDLLEAWKLVDNQKTPKAAAPKLVWQNMADNKKTRATDGFGFSLPHGLRKGDQTAEKKGANSTAVKDLFDFEGENKVTRSPAPSKNDIALVIPPHPAAKGSGAGTSPGLVHLLPDALIDFETRVFVWLPPSDGKPHEWLLFDPRSGKMMTLSNAQQLAAFLDLNDNFVDAFEETDQSDNYHGRVVLSRRDDRRKPADVGGNSTKYFEYYEIHGRWRQRLDEDASMLLFKPVEESEADRKKHLEKLRKKTKIFRPMKSRKKLAGDDRSVEVAMAASAHLDKIVADHGSFAALVKQSLANDIQNTLERALEAAQQIASEDDADTFYRKASDKKVSFKQFLEVLNMGTPSPEAGLYTPTYILILVTAGMVPDILGKPADEDIADLVKGLAMGGGFALQAGETLSSAAGMALLSIKIHVVRKELHRLKEEIANTTDSTELESLKQQRKFCEKELGDASCELFATMAKLTGGALGFAKSIVDICVVESPSLAVHATNLSGVIGSLAMATSVYVIATQSHQVHHLRKRVEKIDVSKRELEDMRLHGDGSYDPVLHQYLRFGAHKLRRRRNMSAVRIAAGVGGLLGGAGTTTAAVLTGLAIANAWNPVGWALGGVGLAIGIGASVYTIHRRVKKKKFRKKRAEEGKPRNTDAFAQMMVAAYIDREFHDRSKSQWEQIRKLMEDLKVVGPNDDPPWEKVFAATEAVTKVKNKIGG